MAFITPEETASIIGVGMNTMYSILNNDRSFPAVRCGRKWVINSELISKWFSDKLIEKTNT